MTRENDWMTTDTARHDLSPVHNISRVIKGGWQLAGGHGRIDREQALGDMLLYVRAGITTFDCADIYTGVESLIGEFLRRHGDDLRSGALPEVKSTANTCPISIRSPPSRYVASLQL